MNKSLGTNLLAVALIVLSYLSPLYAVEIRTMGLYSFSGAITNWLAIHMLFEKIPFLYGSGIIIDRFEEFKEGIRSLMMDQFFTEENLNKFIKEVGEGSSFNGELMIEAIDFDQIFEKLKGAIVESPFGGMLGMFGGEAALEPLRPAFELKFKEVITEMSTDPAFIAKVMGGDSQKEGSTGLGGKIAEIVNGRLDELTPQMVKLIIQKMIREHLGWLVVWGGIFGALIGLVTTFI